MRIRNIIILLVILLILGGYFYLTYTPETPPASEPKIYVWDIKMDEIKQIEIVLPHENISESFIKIEEENKFPWHFDDPQMSEVDIARWGGGIPLILSGPGVERIITRNATEEKLNEFGLTQPRMEITLTLQDETILHIAVGDSTPNEATYYVKVKDSNDVALVDYTWYEVLERLVKEPPYASTASD